MLLEQIDCPHCWTRFPAEDILAVAEDPTLVGDSRLGDYEQKRFLPTEFNEHGEPLDLRGRVCHRFACPNCHLNLPACVLEAPTLFMSIAGAPASGKSFYLAAATYNLPGQMLNGFSMNFTEPDPVMNERLIKDRDRLFINVTNSTVTLDKTQEPAAGLYYDDVDFDGVQTIYPKPFIFNISPRTNHPAHEDAAALMRTFCLYDNAGESYLPRAYADPITLPVTRHLARSAAIFFLFDPTQDARFVRAGNRPGDHNVERDNNAAPQHANANQEAVVAELIRRLRDYRHMNMRDRFQEPFIVIVSKADVWGSYAGVELDIEPIARMRSNNRIISALRAGMIREFSSKTRKFLLKNSPALIANVEGFADNVLYIPVSATGREPETDAKTGEIGFHPKDIKPKWVTVPFLYALARLIPDSVTILDR
ncbi:MAG: hypothetical protein Q4G03_09085 [Planctomycetia bacterium]|nr:hypothetical protein [Planctomycetia bacterium]